jgi:hypothetical protein
MRSQRKAALFAELADLATRIVARPQGQSPPSPFEPSPKALTVRFDPIDLHVAADP